MDIKKALGKRLAKERKKRGLTQVDLSITLGTSDKYIGKVENGRTNLGICNIQKFAQAFDLQLEELFKGIK